MWQRIQTVWWILASLIMALFAVQDLLLFFVSGQGATVGYVLTSMGVARISDGDVVYSTWAISVLAWTSVALSLVSISIYKMRPFQLRLSILNALILVGLIVYIGYVAYSFYSQVGAVGYGFKVWLALPIITIILQIMAARGVLRDETLVRMSSRLR